jgi:hypothetical protein
MYHALAFSWRFLERMCMATQIVVSFFSWRGTHRGTTVHPDTETAFRSAYRRLARRPRGDVFHAYPFGAIRSNQLWIGRPTDTESESLASLIDHAKTLWKED